MGSPTRPDRSFATAPAVHTGSEPRPDLSVIIANLNRGDLLEPCLASVCGPAGPIRLEVIVVDNGSTDGSAELVRQRFPGVRLIRNPSNAGFARANNQGLGASTARHVMLLNNDTVALPHALQRLVAFMDRHPDVGACGPTLRYPDGRLQRSSLGFPTPWGFASNLLFLDRLFPRSRLFASQATGLDHHSRGPVDHPIGAALVVRREAFEQVGGLDERFRVHFNDVDWCYRIHKAGWKLRFVPDAEVIHHGGQTVRAGGDPLHLQDEIVRNMLDYYHKHFGATGLLWVRAWALAGLGPRFAALSLIQRLRGSADHRVRLERYRLLLSAAWRGASEAPSADGGDHGFAASAPTEKQAPEVPERGQA
jgi:GT2 family glycosyltransferase